MMPLHQRRTHPTPVAGCFGCKVGTLQFSPGEPTWGEKQEAAWDRDIPAYKRLRAQGYQPPRSEGCAELEAGATTEYEIARGKVYADKKKLNSAISLVEDVFARPVTEPVIDPVPQVVG